ncbi:MAG: nuclear transport factor 2 family protein [Sphingomonadaceae bacterium]
MYEKNVQRLIDLEDIRKLQLDYATYNETLDLDGLMSLFTEDAVLTYPKAYGGEWTGRDVLRENFSYWMKEEKAPFNALYVVTNPNITITGPDTAHGRWTFTNYLTQQEEGSQLVTPGGQNQPLFILGMYEGDYRKVDGQWKISLLKLTIFWPEREFDKLRHPDA